MRVEAIAWGAGYAEVRCPFCGELSTISLGEAARSVTPVRVRVLCSCGRRLVVFVERRAAVRKAVDLMGRYRRGRDAESREMRVCNLSRTGLLFECRSDDDDPPVAVGDRLLVEFTLEHAERTCFIKEVIVRRLEDREIGAEFAPGPGGESYDRVYDLALALYEAPADE